MCGVWGGGGGGILIGNCCGLNAARACLKPTGSTGRVDCLSPSLAAMVLNKLNSWVRIASSCREGEQHLNATLSVTQCTHHQLQ